MNNKAVPGVQFLWCLFLLSTGSLATTRKLSYPDAVHFLNETNVIRLNCHLGPFARTSWLEYLACQRLSGGIWHPLWQCSAFENKRRLKVKDDVRYRVIPNFSENFYYIAERRCSPKSRMVVHRCDPDAPKCDKCTLPFGIQEGRISIKQPSSWSKDLYENEEIKHHLIKSPGYGWCGSIEEDNNNFLQVDLVYIRLITGIATKKKDSVKEFSFKYSKKQRKKWRSYKEDGKIKVFKINYQSKGLTTRHWFNEVVEARYVRFHVIKWGTSMCLHVEVYGCDDERTFVEKKLNRPEEKNNKKDAAKVRRDTLIACYVAAGMIAIIGLYIVYKWEYHERKIRPDYLK